MVTVETSARLHVGFQNLSLAHDRLYGGIGLGLDEPHISIEVSQAEHLDYDDDCVQGYAETALDVLDVPGARLTVDERYDRHVGLGSGTQLALACLVGIAKAYGKSVDPREAAPEMGRGGRSGVGVATFETGGFVVDAGHPTERFTTSPPAPGNWEVPAPIVATPLPEDWRFVVVTPAAESGQSGSNEDASMQSAVDGANPTVADDIAAVLTRELLPAIAEGNIEAFGDAVERIGRLNGTWYADEQGGVYRPPAGDVIERLSQSEGVFGTGQSSWGPTVYGVTDVARATQAREAATAALGGQVPDGTVRVVEPSASGYSLTRE
ncbi:beta-ribofuranosylaminobenzene 5'-phosphate synthase [Halovenus aranensis]|uniref:Beta-ribofuranosylaminobenzene 5'-phosphate synthase n=1 Tax=Halovenus aranensis TaxID=890420 RepID=A0A1G8U5F1_9EURY|nr:beta-ribofuranosylaminobenzene 5'-phosphate synthase family protein [Halovenus aranensis]SDJ48939.1 beta-ribofuranosylaminobenzene 5'-phosphate synthase [Halovenus aranensis]